MDGAVPYPELLEELPEGQTEEAEGALPDGQTEEVLEEADPYEPLLDEPEEEYPSLEDPTLAWAAWAADAALSAACWAAARSAKDSWRR